VTPEDVRQLLRDYAETFGSAAGQRVLADIRHRGFIGESTVPISAAALDPYRAILHEGMRRLALEISKNYDRSRMREDVPERTFAKTASKQEA
jgi:hypothetical protein